MPPHSEVVQDPTSIDQVVMILYSRPCSCGSLCSVHSSVVEHGLQLRRNALQGVGRHGQGGLGGGGHHPRCHPHGRVHCRLAWPQSMPPRPRGCHCACRMAGGVVALFRCAAVLGPRLIGVSRYATTHSASRTCLFSAVACRASRGASRLRGRHSRRQYKYWACRRPVRVDPLHHTVRR